MLRYLTSYYGYNRTKTIFVILIVSVLTIVFSFANTSLNDSNKEYMGKLLDLYGGHDCIFFDLSEDQYLSINSDRRVSESGVMINSGSFPISDSDYSLSLGWFDDDALELGHISLMEGSMPADENDICIEEHFRYLFDHDLSIGDVFSIIINGERSDFIISGFISDYTAYWLTPDNIVPGYNDYPNALIIKEKAESLQESLNLLAKIKGTGQIISHDSFNDMLLIVKEHEVGSFLSNDNHGDTFAYAFYYPLRLYTAVFSVLFMVLSVVVLYYILKLMILRYVRSSSTMNMLGMNRLQRFRTYCLICIFPLAVGILIGTVASMLILKGFNLSIFLSIGYLLIAYTVSSMILYAVLFHIFPRKIRSRKDFSTDYRIEITYESMRSKSLSLIPIIMMIIILFSTVFIIDIDKRSRYDDISSPNYLLYSVSSAGYNLDYYQGFKVMSYVEEYDYRQIRRLREKISDRAYFNFSFESNCSLIIPSLETDYWKTVMNESVMVGEMLPYLPDDLFGTQNYNLVVVKDHLIDDFRLQYPDIDTETDLAPGKCVLYSPPKYAFDESTMTYTKPVYDDVLSEGGELKLGCLTYESSFSEAIENKDFQYKENSLLISKVYHEHTMYYDGYSEIYSGNNPLIFISEQTAAGLDLFPGIRFIEMLIPADAEPEEYDEIKREFLKVALSAKGADIYEDRFIREFFVGFYERLDRSILINTVLYIIALLIALYAIIDTSIRKNDRKYAVLKSMGCSYKDFFLMSVSEYGSFALIAYIITTAMTYVLIKMFIQRIFGIAASSAEIMPFLMTESIVFLGILAMTVLLSLYCAGRIVKEDISEYIAYTE